WPERNPRRSDVRGVAGVRSLTTTRSGLRSLVWSLVTVGRVDGGPPREGLLLVVVGVEGEPGDWLGHVGGGAFDGFPDRFVELPCRCLVLVAEVHCRRGLGEWRPGDVEDAQRLLWLDRGVGGQVGGVGEAAVHRVGGGVELREWVE